MNDPKGYKVVNDVLVARLGGTLRRTALDALAKDAVDALLEVGWAPPQTVAALVFSAGGRVEVSEQTLRESMDSDVVLRHFTDFQTGARVVTAHHTEGENR